MSAAESLGEKRNSFVFPLTKISRKFICKTQKKKMIYLYLLVLKHERKKNLAHSKNIHDTV